MRRDSKRLADELVAGLPEELAGAPVDLFDDMRDGIEDDDRFDHGVEDHPVAVGLAIRADREHPLRESAVLVGDERFWHGSSLLDWRRPA